MADGCWLLAVDLMAVRFESWSHVTFQMKAAEQYYDVFGYQCHRRNFFRLTTYVDCKTVVFFANASDAVNSNERSGASVETARERVKLARFTREDHAYGASRRIGKKKRLFCSLQLM